MYQMKSHHWIGLMKIAWDASFISKKKFVLGMIQILGVEFLKDTKRRE